MAVIPGNSHPVPDSGQSVESIQWMQDVTEDTPKQQMREQVGGKISGARRSLLNDLLGGLFSGFLGIIQGNDKGPSWLPKEARDAANSIRDGQLDLTDRTDVLAPLLNYGSAYCPVETNGDPIGHGTMEMPFTEIIGYSKNVDIANGGGLILGEKGTWDITCSINTGFVRFNIGAGIPTTYRNGILVNVKIFDRSGELFSVESKWVPSEIGFSALAVANIYEMRPTNVTFATSVQVPDSGYTVKVDITSNDNNRPVLGGPRWSRLRAQNISNEYFDDRANGGEDSSEGNNSGSTEVNNA